MVQKAQLADGELSYVQTHTHLSTWHKTKCDLHIKDRSSPCCYPHCSLSHVGKRLDRERQNQSRQKLRKDLELNSLCLTHTFHYVSKCEHLFNLPTVQCFQEELSTFKIYNTVKSIFKALR